MRSGLLLFAPKKMLSERSHHPKTAWEAGRYPVSVAPVNIMCCAGCRQMLPGAFLQQLQSPQRPDALHHMQIILPVLGE